MRSGRAPINAPAALVEDRGQWLALRGRPSSAPPLPLLAALEPRMPTANTGDPSCTTPIAAWGAQQALCREEGRDPMARPGPASTPAGCRVLVVDDNPDVAQSTAMLLGLLGCVTRVVYRGSDALEAIERFRPEAVLIDIGMPEMNGYEVAARIRSSPGHAATLLVAVSGYGPSPTEASDGEAAFDHHFIKPLEVPRIGELLQRMKALRGSASPL